MTQRAKYLSAAERRAGTVEAVVALAAEGNPSEITTAAIAGRMGLTQGALFRHFPTKDAILEAVMTWVAERLLARVDKAAAGAASPVGALEAVFMAHVDFISKYPGVPRMLFGELQRAEDSLPKQVVRTLLGRYRERLGKILESAKTQGVLPADLDVPAAASFFVGSIQGLVIQSLLAGNPVRMRADAQKVFAIYRRGIGGGP